jgi:hypothetical protein
VFTLAYKGNGGFPYHSIMEMEPGERRAHLLRVKEWVEREAKQTKTSAPKPKKGKVRGARVRRRR